MAAMTRIARITYIIVFDFGVCAAVMGKYVPKILRVKPWYFYAPKLLRQPPLMRPISSSTLCNWNTFVSLTSFSSSYSLSFSIAIIEVEYYLERNLRQLHADVNNGSYRHGDYDRFVVHDMKPREIAIANGRDRVVHRLLYDYLVPIWDKTFIYDAWSCRENKGLLGGIERAQTFMVRYPEAWVWQADIIRQKAIRFLGEELFLTVNPKIDHVQPAYKGVGYLGVEIYPSGRRLQQSVRDRIRMKATSRNIASYHALVAVHEKHTKLKDIHWTMM